MGVFKFLDIGVSDAPATYNVGDAGDTACELMSCIGSDAPCHCQWAEAAALLRDSAARGPDGKLFLECDGKIYFGMYKDDPLILGLEDLDLVLDVTRITTIVRSDISVPNIHICMANVKGTYVLLGNSGGNGVLTAVYGVSLRRAVMAIHTDIPFRL